jgi:hypothetical protein
MLVERSLQPGLELRNARMRLRMLLLEAQPRQRLSQSVHLSCDVPRVPQLN